MSCSGFLRLLNHVFWQGSCRDPTLSDTKYLSVSFKVRSAAWDTRGKCAQLPE